MLFFCCNHCRTVEQFGPDYLAFPYLQAMTIYQRLFDWVVKQLLNSSVEMEDWGADSIALVIIHGIEIFQQVGMSGDATPECVVTVHMYCHFHKDGYIRVDRST